MLQECNTLKPYGNKLIFTAYCIFTLNETVPKRLALCFTKVMQQPAAVTVATVATYFWLKTQGQGSQLIGFTHSWLRSCMLLFSGSKVRLQSLPHTAAAYSCSYYCNSSLTKSCCWNCLCGYAININEVIWEGNQAMFFIKKRTLSSLDHLTDWVHSTAEEETSVGDRQDQGQAGKWNQLCH